MLSDYAESFDDSGLEGTSDDSREPSDFLVNNEYDEGDVPEFLPLGDDLEPEREVLDSDTALETGIIAPYLMELQDYTGDLQLEPSQTDADVQMGEEPVKSFGHAAGQPMTGKLSQPPSIVVSNIASDGVAHGEPRDLSDLYRTIPSLPGRLRTEETTEKHPHGSIALSPTSTRVGRLDRLAPNNYELATQDRQPPDIPTGIEGRSEETAAASMYAFCADADSIAVDATAACGTDTNLLHVKRRRRSATHHGFQTPAKSVRSSQQRQVSLGDSPSSSAVQNSLQVLTPPLSFRDLPPCQHPDNITSRNSTLSVQTTQPCNAPIEPLTPVSPSPSTLSGADDDVVGCSECPDAAFKGPNRKNSLQRHQRDHHSGMPRLPCLVLECSITFAPGRKDNRVKHVKAIHPEYALSASHSKRKRNPDGD